MNKIFKHILSLAAFASLFVGVASAQTKTLDTKDDPINLTKVAIPNRDGSFTLRLESFVTGYFSNVTQTVVRDTDPLDIILLLDMSTNMNSNLGNTDRVTALHNAVSGFVDVIKSNSPTTENRHRIAFVSYASSLIQQTQFLDANSSDVTTAVNFLVKKNVSSGRDIVKPIEHAEKTLLPTARENAKKIIVLFSCGGPSSGNSFDENLANTSIVSAYNSKHADATIYDVTIFKGSMDQQNITYMNYISSNYPDARSMTNGGTQADTKYAMSTDDPDELNEIFKTIAEENIQKGGAGREDMTTSNNVTVRDIITPQFVIPTGTNGSITIKTADVTNVTKATTFDKDSYVYQASGYTWGPEVTRDDLTLNVSTGTDGKTTVNVSGFDFSANWVGLEEVYKNNLLTSSTYRGKKLIIEIKIEPNPDDEGGAVQTNDPASGIYIGSDPTSVTTEIETYPSTGTQFVPMDMIISKSGLVAGETAIFKVYQGATTTGTPYLRVALTADETGTAKVSVAKLPVGTNTNPLVYTVVEETNWTYRYTNKVIDSNSHALFIYDESAEDPYTITNEFKFGIESTDWDVKYYFDENSNNNVFKAVNSAKSTTTTPTN